MGVDAPPLFLWLRGSDQPEEETPAGRSRVRRLRRPHPYAVTQPPRLPEPAGVSLRHYTLAPYVESLVSWAGVRCSLEGNVERGLVFSFPLGPSPSLYEGGFAHR